MTITRESLLTKQAALSRVIHSLTEEFKTHRGTHQLQVMAKIREAEAEIAAIEGELTSRFVPWHAQDQLISPRSLLVGPLFSVRNKTMVRDQLLDKEIGECWRGNLRYSGPELRQSDALVFSGLLNLVQEVPAGFLVDFNVKDLCIQLFGSYDGHVRNKLKEHIIRLQSGVLRFETFSVQLCLLFKYPEEGNWQVSLDPELVFLFKERYTWISLNKRKSLREGLSTWLYAYVACQKVLTKISIEQIKILSGSDAEIRAFTNTLRNALQELENNAIIVNWKISRGYLTWTKMTHPIADDKGID